MSVRKILTKMFSFFKNIKKPVKTDLKQDYIDLENTMERICGCCGHKTKLI